LPKGEEIVALGHDLQSVEEQAPTCNQTGHSAYWSCATCGKYFADEEGTTEITDHSSVILPLTQDHNYNEDSICLVCGIQFDFSFDLYGKNVTVTGYHGTNTVLAIPSTVKVYGRVRSVTAIAQSAFSNQTALTAVEIPATVTSIGNSAFSGCTALTEIYFNAENCADETVNSNVFASAGTSGEGITVTIGDDVQNILAYLFYNAVNVKTVIIGDYVASVGTYAFYGCSNMETLTIGKGVTSLGVSSFNGCRGLKEIYFNATNCADMDSSNYNFTNAGSNASSLTLIVGDNVQSIPSYLFFRNIYLTTVHLGNHVTTIGKAAFSGCNSLQTIAIPDSVETIGDAAFRIAVVILPDDDGSSHPYGLRTITIGSGLKTVGADAFTNCNNLNTVYYKGTEEDWSQITFGRSNSVLTNGDIRYYYSEKTPEADGNYWCYDAEGLPMVWSRNEQ
jgi:hypothetical protein